MKLYLSQMITGQTRLSILFLTTVLYSAFAQSPRDRVIDQTRRLAPEEFEILLRNQQLPATVSFTTASGGTRMSPHDGNSFAYLHADDPVDLLGEMDTNIHEINHGLTHDWAFHHLSKNGVRLSDRMLYYFYIRPGEEFFVNSGIAFFPSRDLVPDIPADRQTFRFGTYVDGTSSTQDHGLLGLLDEFNSYFHSLKVSWLLKPAYLEVESDPASAYINWIRAMSSVGEAYYEFRFFIFEYLLHARSRKPEVYQAIRADTRFRDVFNSVSGNYGFYIRALEQQFLTGWKDYAASRNLQFRLSDNTVFMGRGSSMHGFSILLEDAEILKPVLSSNRYTDVMRETGFN